VRGTEPEDTPLNPRQPASPGKSKLVLVLAQHFRLELEIQCLFLGQTWIVVYPRIDAAVVTH
jgi:hypothetical protein